MTTLEGERTIIAVGPFVILKIPERIIFDGGETGIKQLELKNAPYRIFCYLLEAGRPVPRQELSIKVLNRAADPMRNVVDSYISIIRKELRRVCVHDMWITTIKDVGYAFNPNPPPEV